MVMAVTAPATETLADHELVQHVLAGERAMFERLVRRHNQRLFRAARAIVRSDIEAEDVLQQAWLEVYRHLASFRLALGISLLLADRLGNGRQLNDGRRYLTRPVARALPGPVSERRNGHDHQE